MGSSTSHVVACSLTVGVGSEFNVKSLLNEVGPDGTPGCSRGRKPVVWEIRENCHPEGAT